MNKVLLPFHISFNSSRDYLLSIRGLGLKSVECVRLLTLHHMAFPVCFLVPRPPKIFSSIFLILKLYADSGGHQCWSDMREAWMGATSTPARVSSVAPIGNVFIFILCCWSFSIYDQPWHIIWSSIMKVSHARAHTEIPLASTMQVRSTDIVRLVQSIYLIIYLAGQIHWCLPLCRYELHYQMITFGKVVNMKTTNLVIQHGLFYCELTYFFAFLHI